MHSRDLAIPSWHIDPLTIAEQQQHIAHSELLLGSVQPGDAPTLYWYLADTVGLVLGFSQKLDVLNPTARAAEPIPVYQRRAGGTAVLVGPHLLSLDILLPAGHPLLLPDIVESYRWFGEAWVETLHRLGIDTRVVPPAEAHAQRALAKQPETRAYESLMQRACYGSLSPYEVAAGQRKVVGLAMIRRRAGSLLQAGLILHWETETLARLLGHTPEEQAVLREGLLERAIGIDALAERMIQADEVIATFDQTITSLYTG